MNTPKILASMTLLIVSPLCAQTITKAQISIPQLIFQNNKGSGSIQNISLETDGLSTQALVPTVTATAPLTLSRNGKSVNVAAGVFNLALQTAPNFLLQLNSMDLEQLVTDIGSNAQLQLKAQVLKMDHQSFGQVDAESVSIACAHSSGPIGMDQVVTDCLNRSTISMGAFQLPNTSQFWLDTMVLAPKTTQENAQQTINDMDMTMNQGNFDLSMKVQGVPFAKIHATGNAKMDTTAQVATIRIDEVKYGVIPITGLVMDQLKKKLPADQFRVVPPYVYMTLKN